MTKDKQVMMKDTRVPLDNYRIEHEGTVWNIDGKWNPATKTLKVYRVHGDVNQPILLSEALEVLTNELGLGKAEVK